MLYDVRVPLVEVLMVGVVGSSRLYWFLGLMGLLVSLPRLRRLVFGLIVC